MTIVALLQLNHTVGDIDANVKSIENAVGIAQENGALMAVSSELAISGYPPRDLLEKHGFVRQCIEATKSVQVGIPTIVGTPIPPEAERTKPGNGAVRIIPGRPSRVVTQKQLLPTYDVFDEERYFHPDSKPGILRLPDGKNIGVTICEDAWQHAGLVPSDYSVDPIEQLSSFSIDGESLEMSLNLSSSPYHVEKQNTRALVARSVAKTLEHPFLLCNQVGANDDLIFDGRSLIAWPDGGIIQAPAWKEGILLIDTIKRTGKFLLLNEQDVIHCEMYHVESESISRRKELLNAITIGVRDYCRKSGLESVVLGMSGGIDSAVSAAICVRALGAKNVIGISMPSRHSSEHSITDAEFTAEKLGIELLSMSIEDIHISAESVLIDELEKGHSVAAENIQSRLRGMLVMGVANARGAMAIATGNKSELSMGYCTLYGDMAGGYSPLGDVWKTEVYELAKEINFEVKASGLGEPISESTITKPPSAELAPDQTDQDNLPPYEILDSILQLHMEEGLDADAISGFTGLNISLISDILLRFGKNEHKRWQMSPSPRVSKRAFGQGWRQPLAAKKN